MPSNLDHIHQAPGAEGVSPTHPAAEHATILDRETCQISFTRKKIAICGFASSSRHRMPFDDPAWSIWAMNQLYRHIPRLDRQVDIHHNWLEGNVEGTDHPAWLAQCGIPVVMTATQPNLPTSVRYPIERLIRKFGVDYFTSTVAFMIAMAIDEIDRDVESRLAAQPATMPTNGHAALSVLEASRVATALYGEYAIGIFGIDLVVGDEYDFQKACAEFWIGMANARGIEVQIAPESALCKQRWRYGYQAEPTGGLLSMADLKKRIADIQARSGPVREAHSKAIAELQTLDGAIQEAQHHLAVMELRSRGAVIPLSSVT